MMGKKRAASFVPARHVLARGAAVLALGLIVNGIAGAAVEEEKSSKYRPGFELAANAEMMESEEDMAYDEGPPRMASIASMKMRAPPQNFARGASSSAGQQRSGRSGSSLGSAILEEQVDPLDVSAVARQLVRTGQVTLETLADVQAVAAAVADYVNALAGGFVERQNANNGWVGPDDRRRGRSVSMTLRVPVDEFGAAMKKLTAEGLGGTKPEEDVASASEDARDMTTEYVDAAARERALQATRQQLLKLMESADEVNQVLQVQRELSNVNQQIEAKKAQMLRISRTAALSTIRLEVRQRDEREPPKPPETWSISRSYARAFRWLGRRVRNAVDVAVFLSVASIPIAAVLAAALALCGRAALAKRASAFADAFKAAPQNES